MTSVTVSNLPPTAEATKLIDIKIGQYFTGTTINGISVVGEIFLATSLGVARLTGPSKGGFYLLYGKYAGNIPQPSLITGYKPFSAVNLEVLL